MKWRILYVYAIPYDLSVVYKLLVDWSSRDHRQPVRRDEGGLFAVCEESHCRLCSQRSTRER